MLRQSPRRTATLLAANRANARKSTGPRTKGGLTSAAKRNFSRLLGVPEAVTLDQEPGSAIHLYHELIAPYEPAPALLAMHFRDLARLQLELQAWEGIRDAQIEHRAEQTSIEVRRRRREMDRDLAATTRNIFETGLCRLPDSSGKFNDQSGCLLVIKAALEERDFGSLGASLERLYGNSLSPDHERGMIVCSWARRLMNPEGVEPLTDEQFDDLKLLVEAEQRDVIEAWELTLDGQRLTAAAGRARLAPTREDHWMNRQGDRLRQAIDRKMRFTPLLLQALGLAHPTRPGRPRRRRKTPRKNIHTQSRNVTDNKRPSSKQGG